MGPMPTLPCLDLSTPYICDPLDLAADRAARIYWLDLFAGHLKQVLPHCIQTEGGGEEGRRKAEAFFADFSAVLKRLVDEPLACGPLNVMRICQLRQECQRRAAIADPYRIIKQHENSAALKMLPELLEDLDRQPPAERIESLVRGILAGNLFDLGSSQSIGLYERMGRDFLATRWKLPGRPWLMDGLDELRQRMAARTHRRVVMLVDNAGVDVTLGMIPLARELAMRGGKVILSANQGPALNDITHDELLDLLEQAARLDDPLRKLLAEGAIEAVCSGNRWPLIDLMDISPELSRAADGADLLVLEGMGRAVQSNLEAKFACDALKIAMVKDEDVARRLGGHFSDVICRFEMSEII